MENIGKKDFKQVVMKTLNNEEINGVPREIYIKGAKSDGCETIEQFCNHTKAFNKILKAKWVFEKSGDVEIADLILNGKSKKELNTVVEVEGTEEVKEE